jgi:hypothetical protein
MRRPQYYFLLIVLCTSFNYNASAQKCPTSKQLKTLLPGTWKLKSLWTPNYEKMDDEDNYYPIDKNNIEKFYWEEQSLEQSRYIGDFGLVSIEFIKDGTFKAQHYDGRQISGEWSYKVFKKRSWVVFNIAYKALSSYDKKEYDYTQKFDQLELKANELIIAGDTCYDGCVLKAVFEK